MDTSDTTFERTLLHMELNILLIKKQAQCSMFTDVLHSGVILKNIHEYVLPAAYVIHEAKHPFHVSYSKVNL